MSRYQGVGVCHVPERVADASQQKAAHILCIFLPLNLVIYLAFYLYFIITKSFLFISLLLVKRKKAKHPLTLKLQKTFIFNFNFVSNILLCKFYLVYFFFDIVFKANAVNITIDPLLTLSIR